MFSFHRYVSYFGDDTSYYGIAVGLALAVIATLVFTQFRRLQISQKDENRLLICFPLTMLTGVLFAFLWDAVLRDTWQTWFGSGTVRFGFTYFGWLFGAILSLLVYGRTTSFGGRFLMNLYLPSFAVAQAIGRIGCFLGGCCYGCPCKIFGVCYPVGSLPYEMVGNVPLLPVQLIESVLLLGVFVLCICVPFRHRSIVYLTGVSIERFILEFFRYDIRGDFLDGCPLSPGQCFSIFFLGIAAFLFLYNTLEQKLNRALESL